jgi:predicted DNA-binding transcriptional regulator YafY
LQEAVWKERKLKFKYQRGDDCDVERVVDPLGLVAKGSVWYLVAAIDGDVRNYRVARVLEAELQEQSFNRPAAFDLATHWRQSYVEFKSKFPRYPVTARVRPESVNRLYVLGGFSRVEHIDPAGEDGWARVAICFQFEDDACERLVGLGDQVEVLDPPELRDKIVERARRVIRFYEDRIPSDPAHKGPGKASGIA